MHFVYIHSVLNEIDDIVELKVTLEMMMLVLGSQVGIAVALVERAQVGGRVRRDGRGRAETAVDVRTLA